MEQFYFLCCGLGYFFDFLYLYNFHLRLYEIAPCLEHYEPMAVS